jgi:hypothetical protein
MGTELQSGPLPKFIRATIGTPCLLPQTVSKRTEFLFCNLRIHVQPRKKYLQRKQHTRKWHTKTPLARQLGYCFGEVQDLVIIRLARQ